jgi:hypothetical protein
MVTLAYTLMWFRLHSKLPKQSKTVYPFSVSAECLLFYISCSALIVYIYLDLGDIAGGTVFLIITYFQTNIFQINLSHFTYILQYVTLFYANFP